MFPDPSNAADIACGTREREFFQSPTDVVRGPRAPPAAVKIRGTQDRGRFFRVAGGTAGV